MILMETISIRPLKEISEFIGAIEVQKLTWNRSDYSLIPPTIFKSFMKNGGCVIGAIAHSDDDSEKVIGYAIGYLGTNKEGVLYHHSQQVAVLPEYQQLGVAYNLKQAQKTYVETHYGITLMTWTVDPLLSKNAFLNYHKLGAIGRIYWDNYYGSREDDLNSGLETDRLEVEWYFSGPESTIISRSREKIPNEFPIYDYSKSGDYQDISDENKAYIGVCIPRDLVELKEKNMALANSLRVSFRKIAHYLIGKNYCIIDLKSKIEPKSILIWTNTLKNIKTIKS